MSFLSFFFGKPRRQQPQRGRLFLEALEDRFLPSALGVASAMPASTMATLATVSQVTSVTPTQAQALQQGITTGGAPGMAIALKLATTIAH